MNKFDTYLYRCAAKAPIEMPADIRKQIDDILSDLPEEPGTAADDTTMATVTPLPQKRRVMQYLPTAACIAFVIFFAMPNLSSTYASALSKVPVLGEVVNVLTIRSYTYDDGNHEMAVLVPEVDEEADSAKQVNAEIALFTDQIIAEFYEGIETYGSDGYGSLSVDHNVMINTNRWFTLRLMVTETAASSYTYYAYYHIDKQTGEIINFGSLFKDESYIDVITAEIKKQINEQMAKNDSLKYFVDDPILVDDFISLHAYHNFSINDEGKLVIPFDEYEIAPGYMGCPEFDIPTKVFANLLRNEYKGLFS